MFSGPPVEPRSPVRTAWERLRGTIYSTHPNYVIVNPRDQYFVGYRHYWNYGFDGEIISLAFSTPKWSDDYWDAKVFSYRREAVRALRGILGHNQEAALVGPSDTYDGDIYFETEEWLSDSV